jgi:hypothetical protein
MIRNSLSLSIVVVGTQLFACASGNNRIELKNRESVNPHSTHSTPTKLSLLKEPANRSSRLLLCRETMTDFVDHTLERAVLRVEHGFLDTSQTVELGRRIESAIRDVETFINVEFDVEHYKEARIVVHLFESRCISHVKGGYFQVATPHIYMSLDEPRSETPKGPYLHEIVHIIAWEWHDLWIREGLAVFLNDELGGYPTYPNYGTELNTATAHSLSDANGRRALTLVATAKRVPGPVMYEYNVRQPFYIQSGAFAKHLWKTMGRENFLQVYRSKDLVSVYQQLEGHSLLEEKARWLDSLRVATAKEAGKALLTDTP